MTSKTYTHTEVMNVARYLGLEPEEVLAIEISFFGVDVLYTEESGKGSRTYQVVGDYA